MTVVHADRRLDTWPLREELVEPRRQAPNGRLVSFIEGEGGDYTGRVGRLQAGRSLQRQRVYLCGPPLHAGRAFTLVDPGVPGKNINYEIFGPDQWMLHDQAREA